MKMWTASATALIALAASTLPARAAEAIEEKQIIAGKEKFDPSSGYIFIQGPSRQVGMFLKTPDQADVDAYGKDWEAALAKAKQKYVKQLARWESEVKTAATTKSKAPEKPVEPTRESFSIGSIETREAASFGPSFVYSKAKEGGSFSYLMKVKPGTYTYHGPIAFDPNQGYLGQCYCMGSIQIEVKAGVITDMGNFLLAAPFETQVDATPQKNLKVATVWTATTVNKKVEGIALKFGLPDTLKSFPYARADFHAAGKSDNHFGVTIARMPPIKGVLAYKRDIVIDVKGLAAQPAGN
jgi:hypothetical protein